MASNIKGITIEIGGNVTPLNKSLEGVNKKSKDLQSELKQVDRLLKLDPKNTELLAQKQKLLTDAVGNTKDKLDTLKEAEKQVQAQFEKGDVGEEQYRAMQREVAKTKQELENLESQAIKSNAVLSKDQAIGNLKNMGKAAVGVTAGLVAAAEGTREYREDLSKLETNATQAGAGLDTTKEALKNLNAITGETDSNVEALSNLMQAGFTDNNLQSAVDALSGAVIKFPDTLKIEGLADGLQETLATGEAVGPFAELLERMGVDLEEFNTGLADASTKGEEQNYVLQELASLGLADVNEAYRENNKTLIANKDAQFAVNDALAKIGGILDPLIAGALGGFADLLQKITTFATENETAMTLIGVAIGTVTALIVAFNIQQALMASGMTLWTAIGTGATAVTTALGAAFTFLTSPIGLVIVAIGAVIAIGVTLYKNWDTIKEKAGELGSWIGEKWDGIKTKTSEAWNGVKDAVGGAISGAKDKVTTKVGEIKDGISDKWGDVKSKTSDTWGKVKDTMGTAMDTAKKNVTDKLSNIKKSFDDNGGGIKGVVAGTMTAVKDNFSSQLNIIDKLTGGKLGNIKNAFSSKMDGARDAVKKSIDKIKGFFNFKWELPKLKMPHFNISGKFSLNPPSVPKFGIDWYKSGAIFTSPTIFNTPNGLKGVGEAGAEAVLPIEKLDNIVASAMKKAGGNMPSELTVNSYTVLDGEIVAQSVNKINLRNNRRFKPA